MYQVMIVDDEIWSAIGIRKVIEEDSERFKLVYETTDSLDALEQIIQLQPDIVFTDIRMPEMSGIELMNSIREKGIGTEFVVVSGFAEFSYVQQALQAGAFDYQLKPFDRSMVKKTLDKLYTKLEGKKKFNDLEFYAHLRDKKDKVPELLRSRFDKELYQKLQIVLLLYKDINFKKISLDLGEEAQSFFMKIGPRKCVYIINSNQDKTDIIFSNLRVAENEIERAALSRVTDSVENFEQLLKETEKTILDSFIYPDEKIFKFKKSRRDIISQLEEKVSDLYLSKKYQQISEIISDLANLFAINNMGIEDVVYLWNRTALSSIERGKDKEDVLDYLDAYELTERFTDISEMGEYLNAQLLDNKDEQTGTVNDKFFEMLRHIDKNYAEDLYLKELCSKFYINMSYCCELFRKYRDMTFSQYLTDVRINKACDLLKNRSITVADACEMVGYKDYFYFNRVFKKKIGCTPSEYHKREMTESSN